MGNTMKNINMLKKQSLLKDSKTSDLTKKAEGHGKSKRRCISAEKIISRANMPKSFDDRIKIKNSTSDYGNNIFHSVFRLEKKKESTDADSSIEKALNESNIPNLDDKSLIQRISEDSKSLDVLSFKNNLKSSRHYSSTNNLRLSFPENNSNKQRNSEVLLPVEYELNYVKTGEDLRNRYITKLINKNIWQPFTKQKSHNSIIIFDWDDTLLCTSFLSKQGYYDENKEYSDEDIIKIKKVGECAFNILNTAIGLGDVYIITNAAPGWVEFSAKKFYYKIYEQLLSKVKIFSARGMFEKLYPNETRQWKINAFLSIMDQFECDIVTNILCLGDSFLEIEAAHVLASKFKKAFIKTVKFKEAPKPEELTKQLMTVQTQFGFIFSAIKNLTIRVEKKPKKEVASKIMKTNTNSLTK